MLKVLQIISFVIGIALFIVAMGLSYIGVPILAVDLLVEEGELWVKAVAVWLIYTWLVGLFRLYKLMGSLGKDKDVK